MSKIYRMESWMPKEQAWKIEGYCSEPKDAAMMGLLLTLKGGSTKHTVTVIDLDDIAERDAICAYLTEYMRGLNQVTTPTGSPCEECGHGPCTAVPECDDLHSSQAEEDWENEGGSFAESNQRLIDAGIVEF